jgi:hypothetical protein
VSAALWFWFWWESGQPPTQVLRPLPLADPDILDLARQNANEEKYLAAQLKDEVVVAIRNYLDRYPDAYNSEIAKWVKSDPETGPLVAHLKPRSLADKIGELRK